MPGRTTERADQMGAEPETVATAEFCQDRPEHYSGRCNAHAGRSAEQRAEIIAAIHQELGDPYDLQKLSAIAPLVIMRGSRLPFQPSLETEQVSSETSGSNLCSGLHFADDHTQATTFSG